MREAPSITIIERLLEAGARVQAYDPEAARSRGRIFGSRITFADKSYDALKGADALAIVTEWNEFREPDFPRMRKLMRKPVVFDGRNIFMPEQMQAHGFTVLLDRQVQLPCAAATRRPCMTRSSRSSCRCTTSRPRWRKSCGRVLRCPASASS